MEENEELNDESLENQEESQSFWTRPVKFRPIP